jgi:hypothetical protein
LGGRIAVAELDQRAAEEIALGAYPRPALPALPCLLRQRDKPIPLGCGFVSNEVGIGRAGALDDPDAAQNSDPAARSVSVPSGPISK